jgi:hypothetical protein
MSECICIHVFDIVVRSPRLHAAPSAAAYLAAAFATKIEVTTRSLSEKDSEEPGISDLQRFGEEKILASC